MKLSTVSLLCAIAYACGALARAEECETEAFNNLPEVCRIESSVPAGSRNITELYRVSELSCDTCGKPLYDYLRCTDSQPNVANVNATCARNKNWLRCRLTFSLIRSAIQSLRGARSSQHHAAHPPAAIDLAITESHITPDL